MTALCIVAACLAFLYLAYLGIVAQEGITVYGETYLPPYRDIARENRKHWPLCATLFLGALTLALISEAEDFICRRKKPKPRRPGYECDELGMGV